MKYRMKIHTQQIAELDGLLLEFWDGAQLFRSGRHYLISGEH